MVRFLVETFQRHTTHTGSLAPIFPPPSHPRRPLYPPAWSSLGTPPKAALRRKDHRQGVSPYLLLALVRLEKRPSDLPAVVIPAACRLKRLKQPLRSSGDRPRMSRSWWASVSEWTRAIRNRAGCTRNTNLAVRKCASRNCCCKLHTYWQAMARGTGIVFVQMRGQRLLLARASRVYVRNARTAKSLRLPVMATRA